ncbi:MAG: serine/threonine protein kinase [Planctomycetota bacterium]|nr:serine/threonine protein kinase [Planctomycetota bacterium]
MNQDANPEPSAPEEEAEALSPSEALRAMKNMGLGAGAPPGETLVDVPSLIGRQLGQYRIEEKLGQGGMGMVFRAYDRHLDRDVALKVIFCGPLDDPRTAERFQREAQSLAKLSHPNLLHVHNVGTDGALLYFSMELLKGETLSQRVREHGKMPAEQLVPLMGQVLSALHYVHGQGITHRDIKGGNIMVCGARAVLMDFGLAKDERQDGLTSAGSVLGTPEYMAPEQADGQAIGPFTDLYSLGVVMYEALCGELPFTGRSALAIIRQHMEAPAPSLLAKVPGLDPRLAEAIHRCLGKTPAERYQDCAEMAADLVQVARTTELAQLAARAAEHRTRPAVSRTAATLRVPESSPGNPPTRAQDPASMEGRLDADEAPPARRMPAWAWAAVGFVGVFLIVFAIGALRNRGRNRDAPQAVKSRTIEGGPDFRLVQFRAAADQEHWTYVVEIEQPDGSWKQETITGRGEFQKRFGLKEPATP